MSRNYSETFEWPSPDFRTSGMANEDHCQITLSEAPACRINTSACSPLRVHTTALVVPLDF